MSWNLYFIFKQACKIDTQRFILISSITLCKRGSAITRDQCHYQSRSSLGSTTARTRTPKWPTHQVQHRWRTAKRAIVWKVVSNIFCTDRLITPGGQLFDGQLSDEQLSCIKAWNTLLVSHLALKQLFTSDSSELVKRLAWTAFSPLLCWPVWLCIHAVKVRKKE